MPDKTGKLTITELRRMVRAHNILTRIKIPPKSTRDEIIKIIEGRGFKVDHKKQMISDSRKDRPRRPKITLKEATEMTKTKPLSEEEKKKRDEKKRKKKGEKAFLKKVIPAPPPVKKSSKPAPKVATRGIKGTVSDSASGFDKEKVLQDEKKMCMDFMDASETYIEGVEKKFSKAFVKKHGDDVALKNKLGLDFKNYEKNKATITRVCGVREARKYEKAHKLWESNDKKYLSVEMRTKKKKK